MERLHGKLSQSHGPFSLKIIDCVWTRNDKKMSLLVKLLQLGGCRALAKNTLAYVPIIGWYIHALPISYEVIVM